MADITFKLTGAAELAKALDGLPQAIEEKIVKDMLRDGAKNLANDIKNQAPVQEAEEKGGHPPGTGKNAIQATTSHKGEGLVVLRPQGFFLHYFEFGTRHQPARPFMRPVLDASGPAILEQMIDLGGQKLEDAVNKAKG